MLGKLSLATVVAAAVMAAPASALTPAPGCNLYAATTGNDTANGAAATPVKSAQKLAGLLAPGQTGCFASGTYGGGMAFRTGGEAGKRVTVQVIPGQRAKIVGQVYIEDGSDFVTVRNLDLDGTNDLGKPSPMVNGDDSAFTGNDVYSSVDSCFVLGDKVWGVADRTLIAGNHIHDCGVDGTNMDHGVYVRQANDTQVIGNVIRSNPDRGVQLYMNSDRAVVRGNVIDNNGEGVNFSGDQIDASDHNLVTANLITNSNLRYDIEYWWSGNGNIGVGNVLSANCIFGGARGTIMSPAVGFSSVSNLFSNPQYSLRSGATYRLKSSSPCKVVPPVLAATAL